MEPVLDSAARLAVGFQVPLKFVTEIIVQNGVEPSTTINGTAFYGRAQIERIFILLVEGGYEPELTWTAPVQITPPNIQAAAAPLSLCWTAPLGIQAGNDSKPVPISVTAYSGGILKLSGWGNVVVPLNGMEIPATVPVLAAHGAALADVLGNGTPTVKNNTLYMAGALSPASPVAMQIVAMARSGVQWQASIGAEIVQYRRVRAGESVNANGRTFTADDQGLILAERTKLREISVVGVGADASSEIRIAAALAAARKEPMPETTITPNVGEQTEQPPMIQASAAPAPQIDLKAVEARRVSELQTIEAKYVNDGCNREKVPGIAAKAVAEGWDRNQLELALIRNSRPTAGSIRATGNVPSMDVAPILTASALLTLGLPEQFVGKHYDERTMNAAMSSGFRGASIHSVLRQTLAAAGMSADFSRVNNEVLRSAFVADHQLRASGMSTISLGGILSNIANKVLLQSFGAVVTSWRSFCGVSDNRDFKASTRYRLTAGGKFEPVPPAGELKHITLGEESYTNTLHTEGAIVAVSRQDLINDDLHTLAQIPKLFGRLSAVALERAVYTALLGNAGSFFSEGHNNLLTGAGSALSITSLSAAETAFAVQVDSNGDPLLIAPAVLLVPPGLTADASSIVRASEIRDNEADKRYPTSNPHAGRFQAVTSPWLVNAAIVGNSTTAWYLFPLPGDLCPVDVAFLDGQQNPTIEEGTTDFNTLGMAMRAFFDFGVSLSDYRAAVKSAGA